MQQEGKTLVLWWKDKDKKRAARTEFYIYRRHLSQECKCAKEHNQPEGPQALITASPNDYNALVIHQVSGVGERLSPTMPVR